MKINLTFKHDIFGYAAAATLLIASIGCDVKKTEEGEMPKVNVEGGKMPKYDVETADVTVKGKEKEVTVPKVTTEKKAITVPDVDVTLPSEKRATPPPPPPPQP